MPKSFFLPTTMLVLLYHLLRLQSSELLPKGFPLWYTFCVKKLGLSVIAAILGAAFLSGCSASGYTVFPDEFAFSDDILFSARILGGRAEYAHERMVNVIEEINKQASATLATSDLYKFNAAEAGERVSVGEHVYELFSLGSEYYEKTGGAFNIAALPLTSLWHIDAAAIGSADSSVSLPTPQEVSDTLEYCDPALVTAEKVDGRYYLTKTDGRVKLDFGGIAKGYAADKCVEVLDGYDEISSALFDISGNAYFYGGYVSGGETSDWNVAIVSPRPMNTLERGFVCAAVVGADTSAVTSGDYMRYYEHGEGDNKVYIPHILGANGVPIGVKWDDTKSAWVNSDEWVVSATVIGKSSAVCDVLSTAVAAMGFEEGGALLKNSGYKGLIFTEKRYTIINGVTLYKPDEYNGFVRYTYYEL